MTSRTNESDLPPGWQREGESLVWTRSYGPWVVRAHCPSGAPFTGPSKLTIHLGVGGSVEEIEQGMAAALETDGIPAGLLRQLPFAEIKAQARAVLAQETGNELGEPWPVPTRCRTVLDYAFLVAELVRMRATGTTAPQQELADRLGIGKATMSERIKRATVIGLWDGKQLTGKAKELLAEWQSEREEQ
ncbi:helix-turn-helix domain-containing protein [Kitasatospora purpeofusca]|uniref:helix-turn-helix domain-containing protein n=1 Tax=Kitasatospora purpeofusca TaxID=67352 RepID=UPI0036D2AD8B